MMTPAESGRINRRNGGTEMIEQTTSYTDREVALTAARAAIHDRPLRPVTWLMPLDYHVQGYEVTTFQIEDWALFDGVHVAVVLQHDAHAAVECHYLIAMGWWRVKGGAR